MLFGCNPFFKSEKLTVKEIRDSFKRPVEFPKEISPQAMDFVKKMLIKDPKARMSFTEFFEHPWLNEADNVSNLSELLRG
jgi:serine/threonine protein kinase